MPIGYEGTNIRTIGALGTLQITAKPIDEKQVRILFRCTKKDDIEMFAPIDENAESFSRRIASGLRALVNAPDRKPEE